VVSLPEKVAQLQSSSGGALTGFIAAALCLFGAAVAWSADETLPPRSEWHATASSASPQSMAPAMAIDGDLATRWDGNFAPGNWLQLDLGRDLMIGGAIIRWDAAFAPAYIIQASTDGKHWQNAFQTADSLGGVDYVFFPSVRARYLRLTSPKDAANAGVSLFEFEPVPAGESPRITGLGEGLDAAGLWSAVAHGDLVEPGAELGTRQLHVYFPKPMVVSGLEVFWNASRRGARLEGLEPSGEWRLMGEDPSSLGDTSYLAASTARTVSELRLTVYSSGYEAPAIRRLRLLSRTQTMSALKRYEIFAGREHTALFPPSLHHQQVYWTAVSVPAGEQKSLFDEYGDLEPFRDGPLLQPLWRDASGRVVAAFSATRTQRLRDGWIPMPEVQWSPQPGLLLRSEAVAVNTATGTATLVRYRLENSGPATVDGQLALLVRPMQVNPVWQNGGISEIRSASFEGTGPNAQLIINGRSLLISLTAPSAQGVAPFGSTGQTEITRYAIEGGVPTTSSIKDPVGLGAAALLYTVHLEPREQTDVVIMCPGGPSTSQPAAKVRRESPSEPTVPSVSSPADFDRLAALTEQDWRARLLHVGIVLPDQSLVDTLRAQIGYMLVNAKGPILLAGPRNYDRSFIRDGAATAAMLLRMGVPAPAREYLHWYADHGVRRDGLISPILNDDGSVNRGVGSELEYDSQGEFVALVADMARLNGGAASVREYLPAVRGALQFLQIRCASAPSCPATRPGARRRSASAASSHPSISHEGYPAPTHSYWDDYWALKGWHDGAWLARSMAGANDMAQWAAQQEAALRDSLAASIRATIEWKHIDYIPASADFARRRPGQRLHRLSIPPASRRLLPDTRATHHVHALP
jgi:hypothetical protein